MTADTFGRPTAAELIAAVAEFLESDVRHATSGQVNFHARVAANVLHMVERELLGADTAPDKAPDTVADGLARLGFADEVELAAAIRAGQLDDKQHDVTTFLRTLVGQRLAVAHPGYAMDAIADKLFAAMEAGDIDTVAAMCSDDVAVWHAGDGRTRDKARGLKVVNWFLSATANRHYDMVSRQPFDGGFVQQHVLSGTARDGKPYSMRIAMIIHVSVDGLITSVHEYFDPATLAPLRNQSAPTSGR
jgi:ketosteroid isomerase-like protein